MALLLELRELDRPPPGNMLLPGSTIPVLLPVLPPYGLLEGEEGMERTMGGDMEPCRLCRGLRLDADRVWTGL